jgi:hypothetical protein
MKDLERVRGLSERQVIEGPEEERFILVVVNHGIEPIDEKIKRELVFLSENSEKDYQLLEKIAETYIYMVTANQE